MRAVAYPDSIEKLIVLINALDTNGVPFFIVGGMSNVLVEDRFYNGVLVKTTKIKNKIKAEEYTEVYCGNTVRELSSLGRDLDLGGFEGLCGIPGTIGGMIRQNAGAFSYEISDRFISADCYCLRERAIRKFTKDEMCFSYRNSILRDKNLVLLCATLKFIPKRQSDILTEINDYAQRRRSTQPTSLPSLGSTFKRCDGISAGYYVDKAGLKGYSIGGAQVSSKHAGFIVNTGGATAKEYIELLDYVKNRVRDAFGVELEAEIEIIR